MYSTKLTIISISLWNSLTQNNKEIIDITFQNIENDKSQNYFMRI